MLSFRMCMWDGNHQKHVTENNLFYTCTGTFENFLPSLFINVLPQIPNTAMVEVEGGE